MPIQASPPIAPPPGSPEAQVTRKVAYLQPGQLLVVSEPVAITTVLGSCVSVCLWDAGRGVGGMNHFLLPTPVDRERSFRFGAVAVPGLVAAVVGAGGHPGRLAAKVFGGASIIGAFRGRRDLGQENGELALRLLGEAGIPVQVSDLGGDRGRKLVFHADDGSAWVRRL